jgi:hypothetical protein
VNKKHFGIIPKSPCQVSSMQTFCMSQ